jgi:hypothetical protein
MCHDTDSDGTNPLISGNSLHHLFSRCVTIHGSHGVHVKVGIIFKKINEELFFKINHYFL